MTVALLGTAAYFLAEKAGDLRAAVDRVGAADWRWLLLAVGFEAASMVVFARLQRWLLRAGGVTVPLRDMVELTRMLRMQGDASDQVAEVMGRTLARLSAEVEALAGALDRSGLAFEASTD